MDNAMVMLPRFIVVLYLFIASCYSRGKSSFQHHILLVLLYRSTPGHVNSRINMMCNGCHNCMHVHGPVYRPQWAYQRLENGQVIRLLIESY